MLIKRKPVQGDYFPFIDVWLLPFNIDLADKIVWQQTHKFSTTIKIFFYILINFQDLSRTFGKKGRFHDFSRPLIFKLKFHDFSRIQGPVRTLIKVELTPKNSLISEYRQYTNCTVICIIIVVHVKFVCHA